MGTYLTYPIFSARQNHWDDISRLFCVLLLGLYIHIDKDKEGRDKEYQGPYESWGNSILYKDGGESNKGVTT